MICGKGALPVLNRYLHNNLVGVRVFLSGSTAYLTVNIIQAIKLPLRVSYHCTLTHHFWGVEELSYHAHRLLFCLSPSAFFSHPEQHRNKKLSF